MDTVAERIMRVIEEKEMSKSEFARKINVTPAYISKIGKQPESVPSYRTISDICREFRVNETWLRTGQGDMFIQKSRDEELAEFFGDLLSGETDFKLRFIAVLSRLSEDEWEMIEAMANKLVDEIKKEKADP